MKPLGWNGLAAYVVLVLVIVLLSKCNGHAYAPYRSSDKQLHQCFVYLPAMKNKKLQRWCLEQSKRLP